MADEQIVTSIVANADFSNLIGDLNKVTAALGRMQAGLKSTDRALANQIRAINTQFGDTLRSTGQFTSHFVTIASDVDKFGKSLDSGKMKLGQYFKVWQEHHRTAGGLIRDLAKQQVQMQNAVLQPLGKNAEGMMRFAVHVPRGLDEIRNKTSLTRQELAIMNKVVQDGAGQLINWGKNTQWAGRQLTVGLTVPLVAFGKASADAFKAADEQLVRLTKVYGDLGGASADTLAKVRKDVADTARELSTTMGVNFKDTIALAADIAATGKTGNELLGSISETTRLAVLGEVDRQEAMKATLAIQSTFKQNTEQLAESINFLNAVENQTSTTLNDLVEAIPRAGTVVQGLGGSVQDLALYLTAMREGGVNAAEGANAIKSSLASLINPTKVAVGLFSDFGIDLKSIVTENAGNLTKTILSLQAALDTLDPLQKQQALEQLFGKFQFARLNALFSNLGKQGSQTLQILDLMKASSEDLANIAGRELAQVTESASGKYKRAIETLKADLAKTGEQFLGIATKVVNALDKIINFINDLPEPIKKIFGLAGAFTAVVGPVIMLTGVLGNFFGYIVKGIYHFKALFKGAEGWKLLTPEIMAANNAASLIEKTFYSDAQAASVLQKAILDLTAQYDALAVASSRAAVGTGSVSTMAGNQVVVGGMAREVDPNHPLAGTYQSRAFAHMVPRKVNQPGTIFGVTPSSGPVNSLIGENPMIYAHGDMPIIPGLTAIERTVKTPTGRVPMTVSTGVVAEEVARNHAMMAALAMQSKDELKIIQDTLENTGMLSTEFMGTFDDILPVTTRLAQKAATESAEIVAKVQAGKLSVEAARARIIELNILIEQEMARDISVLAAARGATFDPYTVPTSTQPSVDPVTGKTNMKELFHKKEKRSFIKRVGDLLRVRTSGAGYNVATTRPIRRQSGGIIPYTLNDGPVVPGPSSDTTDTQFGMLPPGTFIVKKSATADNFEFLSQMVGGGTPMSDGGQLQPVMLTPEEFAVPPSIVNQGDNLSTLEDINSGRIVMRKVGGLIPRVQKFAAINPIRRVRNLNTRKTGLENELKLVATKSQIKKLQPDWRGGAKASSKDTWNLKPATGVYGIGRHSGLNERLAAGKATSSEYLDALRSYARTKGVTTRNVVGTTDQFLDSLVDARIISRIDADNILDDLSNRYVDTVTRMGVIGDATNPYYDISRDAIMRSSVGDEILPWWSAYQRTFSAIDKNRPSGSRSGASRSPKNIKIKVGDKTIVVKKFEGNEEEDVIALHSANPEWADWVAANSGGIIPGYFTGGRLGKIRSFAGRKRDEQILNEVSTRVQSSSYRNVVPVDPGHLISESTGHSFPVAGIGGVYRTKDGDLVFRKPVFDEAAALAEVRAMELLRDAHKINAPRGRVRVIKDPTDFSGKRRILTVESPYDPAFAKGGQGFTRDEMIRQFVASLIRGDKDLSPENVSGNNVADAGTLGIYTKASGKRSLGKKLKPVTEQADINLLHVRGGARKWFAKSTAGVAAEMSPAVYGKAIHDEFARVVPRLKSLISKWDLSPVEKKAYEDMIKRAEAGLGVDWSTYHSKHVAAQNKKMGGKIRGYNAGGLVPGGKKVPGMQYKNLGGVLRAIWSAITGALRGRSTAAATPKPAPKGGVLNIPFMAPGDPIPDQPIPVPAAANAATQADDAMRLSFGWKGQALGMAGAVAGSTIGSKYGMLGSMIGGQVGYMAMFLPQLIKSAKVAGNLASILRKITIPGIAITAVILFGKYLLDSRKRAEELAKANKLAFGGTKESFASVGIKNYKTMADRIKSINEELELHRAKVKSVYESYTKTGVTGLSLTINELREAIKKAKKEQTEYVKAFNSIDSNKVVQYAAQLKAQFLAMGMSAQDATNQIYAIIKASDKASQAFAAITSSDFTSIQSSLDGIKFVIDYLSKSTGSIFNAEEFNRGLDTLLNSILTYRDSLVGAKDDQKNIRDEADAMAETLNKVSKIQGSQAKLNEKQLHDLKMQNLVYAGILGNAETLESITAKILLYSSGLAEIVNLSAMSADAAILLAKDFAQVQNIMNSVTEDTNTADKFRNSISPLSIEIERVKGEALAASTAVKKLKKVDEDYYREKMKAIDKLIAKLQKERDERLKLIDLQERASTFENQIQTAQIKYQQALTAGNMAQAAQEQLNIQQLSSDRQRQLLRDSINEKYNDEIEKLQEQKDKLQEELDNANKNYAAKTTAATEKTAEAARLQAYRDELEMIALRNVDGTINKTDSMRIENIFKEMIDSGGYLKTVAENMRAANAPTAGRYVGSTFQPGKSFSQTLVDNLNTDVKSRAQENSAFASAVERFAAAVDRFSTEKSPPFRNPTKFEKNEKGWLEATAGALGISGETPFDTSTMIIKNPKTGALYYVPIDSPRFKDTYNSIVDKGYHFVGWQNGLPEKFSNDQVFINPNKIPKAAYGRHIKGYSDGSTDGPIAGPGTPTSDSIVIRVSDGEFITRASSVSEIGSDNMHLINQRGAQGVIDAAARLLSGRPRGGPTGSGYDATQDYFRKLGDLSVNFQTDKDTLKDSELRELQLIAAKLAGKGIKSLYVKGYADLRGSRSYNMALSKRRAEYVASYLSELLPGIKFIPIAEGESGKSLDLTAMSKKRKVSIEMPITSGGGLSLPQEPRGLMGSVPFEGLFGGGIGFGGMLTMNKGGQIPGYRWGGLGRRVGKFITNKFENIKGPVSRTFNNVMDYLGLGDSSFDDAFPFDKTLAKSSVYDAVDRVTKNINIIPQKPNDAKQAIYLAKMYRDHAKFWRKQAAKYKNSKQTVEEYNAGMQDMKNLFSGGTKIIDNNPMLKDWKDFVANVEPSDFAKPRSPLDKEFFNIVNNPEVGIPSDRGFTSKGLEAPDLFSGIKAPGNISIFDAYMAKALENQLIYEVYKDLARIIKSDPLLARKLGFMNPRGFAFGGLAGLSKYGTGGGPLKALRKFSWIPQAAGSSAAWMGMENAEGYLSRRWGANENASGFSKWGRALGRVAFNSAQGFVSGLPFLGAGAIPGSAFGLLEGLIGLAREGSHYGVKGGKKGPTIFGVEGTGGYNENHKEYTLDKVLKDMKESSYYGPLVAGGFKVAGKGIKSLIKSPSVKNIVAASLIGASKPFLPRLSSSSSRPNINMVAGEVDETFSQTAAIPKFIEYLKPGKFEKAYDKKSGTYSYNRSKREDSVLYRLPVYTGGPFKSKLAVIQGLDDDFSSLLKSKEVDEIVPTRPQDFLDYIIKKYPKNPNNKNYKNIIDDINEYIFSGKSELSKESLDFLEQMAAATSMGTPKRVWKDSIDAPAIRKSEKEEYMEASGIIDLISAMGGNKAAKDIITIKVASMKNDAKKLTEIYRKLRENLDEYETRDLESFNRDQDMYKGTFSYQDRGTPQEQLDNIAMVRSFNFGLPLDKLGNISERPAGTYILKNFAGTIPNSRVSRHFTTDDAIAFGHHGGSWDKTNPSIMFKLKTGIQYNDNPEQISNIDSIWLHKLLKPFFLPKGSFSVHQPYKDELKYLEELHKLGIIKDINNPGNYPLFAQDAKSMRVISLLKEKYSEKELDQILQMFDSESKPFGLPSLYRSTDNSAEFVTGSSQWPVYYTAADALRALAMQTQKQQLGIKSSFYKLSGGLMGFDQNGSSVDRGLLLLNKIRASSSHDGSPLGMSESTGYDNEGIYDLPAFSNPLKLLEKEGTQTQEGALSTILMSALQGKLSSGKGWMSLGSGNGLKDKEKKERILNAYALYFKQLDNYEKGITKTKPSRAELEVKIEKIIEEIKNRIDFAEGGYVQKFHTLRGEVPGPYNAEVGAILRAKTESVYPTDYVDSLKNATMSGGNTYVLKNEINAAEGMDVNQLADVVTKRTVDAIKGINSLTNKSVGESRRRGSTIAV